MKNQPATVPDVFASIAAQRQTASQNQLVEPPPPRLPRRFLPAARSNPQAGFRPTDKLDTPAKLDRELARRRRWSTRFLRQLAPPVPATRVVVPVTEFDWQLAGTGDTWQRVTIPHYGGPIGRAVAYYRTTFTVTAEMHRRGALFVCFGGVDYRATVFVNDAYVGAHEGFFAPFECAFTASARVGENTLLVKVENDAIPISNNSWGQDQEGDKLYAATGPGWDDPEMGWHHCPPGMGIYQPVRIEARPPVFVRDVFVRPLLKERRAEVWVELGNTTTQPHPVCFVISVFGQNFPATLFRDREFKPAALAGPGVNCFRFEFDVKQPRVWELESPWLYQAQVRLANGDTACRQFGMRSFRMDTAHEPAGRLFLNDREIRLRGANTMGFEQQAVMRGDLDQLRDDILLAKICHMNFWRLTQRPVQPKVYALCDQLGLMTQTDLPLFGYLPRRQFCEAVRQTEEMERLVRGHPCNIMVSYINEPFPPNDRDQAHRQLTRPELEQFFRAANEAVWLANPDRVIKPVDGDYDPPAPGLPDNHCYTAWYNGHGVDLGRLHRGWWQRVKPGWFYGCGEFGAEGLDPADLMRRRYPVKWLSAENWSPTDIVRAQTGNFHYLWFDTQTSIADWVAASQRHQAWATRWLTEAFRRDNRLVSCAIHLFIDAFPAGWMKAIMDCERRPKPAYFAYREALTPLMANIRTDRFSYVTGEPMLFEFWICNDTPATQRGAKLRYQLEVNGRVVFAQQAAARVESVTSTFQGFLRIRAPEVNTRTPATLRLALTLPDSTIIHDTVIELDLWPAPHRDDPPVVFTRGRKAAALARELGCRLTRHLSGADIILADELLEPAAVKAAMKRGVTIVFLELPPGAYEVAGAKFKVEACGMGARHFVSRRTEHPLVAGFGAEDFRLWYDPQAKRIAPLLETVIQCEGWTPILLTGNGAWNGTWSSALACAEQGRIRVCQAKLAGRTRHNPVAAEFARRLLRVGPLGFRRRSSRFSDSAPAFQRWQRTYRSKLAGWLMNGGFPQRVPLAAEVLATEDYPTFTLRRVRYRTLAARTNTLLLALPKTGPQRAPLLVALHGHEATWGEADAGAFRAGHIDDFCAYFAERGWAVVQPATMNHTQQHAGWMLPGEWTWDAMVALDYAAALPAVDVQRIAVCGLSTGGHLAMNLLALDDRIRAGIVGCILSGWHHYRQRMRIPPHCDCGLTNKLGTRLEQCDWAAMAAPKPVQFQHGRLDAVFCPGADAKLLDPAWNTGTMPPAEFQAIFAEVERAYRLAGAPAHANLHFHDDGHRVDAAAAWTFLNQHLEVS